MIVAGEVLGYLTSKETESGAAGGSAGGGAGSSSGAGGCSPDGVVGAGGGVGGGTWGSTSPTRGPGAEIFKAGGGSMTRLSKVSQGETLEKAESDANASGGGVQPSRFRSTAIAIQRP